MSESVLFYLKTFYTFVCVTVEIPVNPIFQSPILFGVYCCPNSGKLTFKC